MALSISIFLSLAPFFLCSLPTSMAAGESYFSVVKFGAKPDGKTDSTTPFMEAWASACRSTKSAVLYVPSGKFLIRTVDFNGPCKKYIGFRIDGTLVAPSNYAVLDKSGTWIGFNYVDGLKIYGGTLDGQGASLWACKLAGRNCHADVKSLSIGHCSNVKISGVTSINSKFFHMFIYGSRGVTVESCKLIAPDNSPNTDGIHVQYSTGVTITSSNIRTGDDCVSLGPATSNVWIENIFCGPGHGISIGSLGQQSREPGVQNVTVKTATFSGTTNGLRIKTWARPSNGFVKGVLYQNVRMVNVRNPIIIDQNYCPHGKGCPNQHSGIAISGVVYNNVKGTSATPVAVKFDCSRISPCNGIRLQDINLTYQKEQALAECKNAAGSSSPVIAPTSCL